MEKIQSTKQNCKAITLTHLIDVDEIGKLIDNELLKEMHSLMEVDTVDKQLLILKKLVTRCKSDEDDTTILLCRIISKIYFNIDSKNPLRFGIVRLISSLSDKAVVNIVIVALEEELKILLISDPSTSVTEKNTVISKVIGCFDNFSVGVKAVFLCQIRLLTYISDALNYCLNKLSDSDLSPASKTEVYQCIHSGVRLAILLLQNYDESDIEYLSRLNTCVKSVLQLQGLPLDTANNCGHFISLFVKHKTKDFLGYIELFEEYRHIDNKIILCLCSGLLNTLSSDELVVNDYRLLSLIFYELVDIHNRNTTDCTVILSLSRVFVVLSRCLVLIPTALISLPELTEFLLSHTWIHLDHFMDSVRHLSNTVLNNIVKIAVSLNSVQEEQNLLSVILENMVASPVWKRAKHAAIQALTEAMPTVKILSSEPDLVKTLLSSLQQPCAPSYMINSVESLMLQHLKEVDAEIWAEVWIGPLLDTMVKNDGRNHGFQKLLTKAIQISPQIVNNILNQNDKNWVISFSCLHACRKLGLTVSNGRFEKKWQGFVDYSFFYRAICHKDAEVRLSCLAVIVESKKTTEHFTRNELEIIKMFFQYNINDYDSAVRHKKLSLVNKLFTRLKNSLQVLKRHSKVKSTQNVAVNVNVTGNVSLKAYQIICEWLVNFCCENLFPGASFGRRSTALSILYQCQEFGLWPDSANNTENAKTFLLCLTDSYEDNKIIARKIIHGMPSEVFSFNDKMCLLHVFKDCLNMAKSYRPPDCVTGAHLLSTLMGFPETGRLFAELSQEAVDDVYSGIQLAIMAIIEVLEKELKEAKSSLLVAAASGPLHGQLLLIRHLLEEMNLEKLSSSKLWRQLIGQLLILCFECSTAVSSVVSNESPEGHLPIALSNSDSDESSKVNDLEKVNVTAQMVLLCSWRTIKEVSLILGHLSKHAPISNDNSQGLLAEEQLISIGDHFITLLAETKHRGAFEQAYTGFCKLTSRLWSFPGGNLHKLPYKWLQDTIEEIASDGKICATRRSAGIPFMIQALVCTEIGIGDGKCFETCIKRLLELSLSKNHSVETRIHALNILRALFRSTELREAVSPFVQDAFIVAISGFNSACWGERNSSTLLFSAMMNRVFGVKRTKGYDLSWKNKMTGRIFFQRYPRLYGFLLDQLSSNEITTSDLRPTSYPVLLLLSRLYPSSLEGTDSNLKLTEFLDPLIECSGSSVMKTRLLAARAVVPLVSPTKCIEHLQKLFQVITASKKENFIHGLLLQIIELVKSEQLSAACESELKTHLHNWIRLLTGFIEIKKNSFIVLCCVIQILNILHIKFYEVVDDSIWYRLASNLYTHVFNSDYFYEINNSDLIGISQFNASAVELLFKLKIFSESEADKVIELLSTCLIGRDRDWFLEAKHKILDIVLYLISDNQMPYLEDEEYFEISQSFIKLIPSRKIQLRESIFNSGFMHSIFFKDLLNKHVDYVKRLLDIFSEFPNLIIFILKHKYSELKLLMKLSLANKDYSNFGLLFLCRLPYKEVKVRDLISNADKKFICEVIVNFVYSNKFVIGPNIRMIIANWFHSAFFYFISSTPLPPDIRLSLWSYFLMLCLDEDKDIRSLLCDNYCQEKTLELMLTKFLAVEKDFIVKVFGLSAWIFGSLEFNDDASSASYRINDKPMDKDELESNYEEIILSRKCGEFLKQIILQSPKLLSTSKIPISLIDWILRHCGLSNVNKSEQRSYLYRNPDLSNVIHFVSKIRFLQINDKNRELSDEFCVFLKYGYKTMMLGYVKYSCFPMKEFYYFHDKYAEL